MNEDEIPEGGKASAWIWPIAGALVCLGLGGVSGWTMSGGGGEWYRELDKPPGTPPGWLFGPVWTLLYLLMGISVGRLIHRRAKGAVTLFVIQFLLNMAWTPVFFGAHAIGWALVIILTLWGFLALTIRSAEKADPLSAMLLLPYLLWIMFATYLNAGIAWLNRLG
jgi:benzodiazapine receptor